MPYLLMNLLVKSFCALSAIFQNTLAFIEDAGKPAVDFSAVALTSAAFPAIFSEAAGLACAALQVAIEIFALAHGRQKQSIFISVVPVNDAGRPAGRPFSWLQ
jgi:hypothetical protein